MLDPFLWKDVETVIKEQEKRLGEVYEEFQKIMREEFLQQYSGDDLIRYALTIYHARIMQAYLVTAELYEIIILDRTLPKEGISKKGKNFRVANLYGLGKKADDQSEKIFFITASAFGGAADVIQKAEIGKVYQTWFTVNSMGKQILDLGVVEGKSSFEKPVGDSPLNPIEVVQKIFSQTPVRAFKENTVTTKDIIMVKGSVAYPSVKPTKDGKKMIGYLTVMDRSMNALEIRDKGGLHCTFFNPELLRVGTGSVVIVLGTLSPADDKYGASLNGLIIIPEFATPGPKEEEEPPMKKAASGSAPAQQSSAAPADVQASAVDFSDFTV